MIIIIGTAIGGTAPLVSLGGEEPSDWILATGTWVDESLWDDTAAWID